MGGGSKRLWKDVGFGALTLANPVAGHIAVMATKAGGGHVGWGGELLSNPLNAAARAATNDKLDFFSRESMEAAAEGAAVGSIGGPFGAAYGAAAGGLVGTAQHYYNAEHTGEGEGFESGGFLGIGKLARMASDAAFRGKNPLGTESLGGVTGGVGAPGFAFSEDLPEMAAEAQVTEGEQVGGAAEENDMPSETEARRKGRLVASGGRTFGFTGGGATLG